MAWHRPQGFGHHWSFRFLARNFSSGAVTNSSGIAMQTAGKSFYNCLIWEVFKEVKNNYIL